MTQSDIDKILEEIKQSRKRSQANAQPSQSVPAPEKTESVQPVNTAPAAESKTATAKEIRLSEDSKQTLADFINGGTKETVSDDVSYEPEYVSKKSEDYIDENFMNFFTQSVIVTKKPEETSNVQIKRKKGSFFKRKYITDSLSLNIENFDEKEEDKEEKLSWKERRRQKKESRRISDDSLPIVKTATDVWAQKNIYEPEQSAQSAHSENADESQTVQTGRTAEITETVKHNEPQLPAADVPADEKSVHTEEVKVYKPKQTAQSLSSILGDDKDPESLAARILQQRKNSSAQQPVQAVENETSVAVSVAEPDTTEIPAVKTEKKIAPSVPDETDGIINSIYTSIIEKQARQELADDMTGFIPEFPEEEKKEGIVQTVVPDEEEEEEEVFEEYISKSEFFDKPDDESADIRQELAYFRNTLNLRIILGLVCGSMLAYFNIAAANSLPLPAFIDAAAQPMMFSLACTVIYAIAFVGFLPTVLRGFTALKDIPAPDSFISLAAVLSLVQLLAMTAFSSKLVISEITIFAAYVCVAMAFNAMGKKIATNTIIKNLTLANAPSGISAGYIINDTDAVKRLARTLDEKVPKVLVSRKTGAITNFVNAGFSVHKSDYTAKKVAGLSYFVTLVCFIMGIVLSKDIATGLFCAAGAAALQIPLSGTMVNSVPSALMQKTLEKVGALVNGWQGIDQLSKTTHVNFDAKHLFPRGTVILHGIKTFEKERIDLAILYAASVLIKECDTLRPVFMEVIDGKTDILPEVDSCEYIELQGYISWINNNRVIIGNRTLMEKYDVDMPPVSMEARFTKQGRKPVYLAVGGKLFGMFVFSYRRDSIVKENIDRLMEKGVSIILSSKDFNIDPHLISDVYEISSDSVSVLNQKESGLLEQFTGYTEESECCVAHLDSLSSLVAGFCGAESAKRAEGVCSLIQTLSVAIGAVLAVMFTYAQTIMQLPLTSILLLGFGFMGLSMLTAVAKKYD